MEADVGIYFRFYFNTMFFLCVTPFHLIQTQLKKNQPTYYITTSWLPQKILCVIQTFLGLLCDIHEFRGYIPRHKMRNDPSKYFQFSSSVIYTILKMITIKKLWLGNSDILNIVNFLTGGNNLPAGDTRLLHPVLVSLVSLMYTGVGVANWLFASRAFTTATDGKSTVWELGGWWTAMVNTGYGMLFIGKSRKEHFGKQIYSGFDNFAGVLGAIGFFNV